MKESVSVTQYFHTPSEDFLNSSVYITWAGHRHCDATHRVGPRMLDSYKLVFVISGKGYLQTDNGFPQVLNQGDLFVLYPKKKHCYYADSQTPWELMWISFNGTLAELLLEDVGFSREHFIMPNTLTHSIQRTVQTIINALGDTADDHRLCATGQLYMLFAYLKQLAENNQKHSEELKLDSCVWKAVQFIEQNYYLDIDVDMLSEHVNYSRSYLSRTFKSETNMTIPEYITKIRVQNAMGFLKNSKMSVKEISTSVGMKDSFYFSKLFKKLTGMTPRDFRKTQSDADLEMEEVKAAN